MHGAIVSFQLILPFCKPKIELHLNYFEVFPDPSRARLHTNPHGIAQLELAIRLHKKLSLARQCRITRVAHPCVVAPPRLGLETTTLVGFLTRRL